MRSPVYRFEVRRATPLRDGPGQAPALTLHFDGAPVPADPRDTVASALIAAGELMTSRSAKYRRPRGAYCLLGDYGTFSTILRVPITFPPERFFGLSLSAMCTPHLRGTQGSFTLFTTDPEDARATTGGLRILVNRNGERIQAYLPGPPKPMSAEPTDFQTLLNIRVFD